MNDDRRPEALRHIANETQEYAEHKRINTDIPLHMCRAKQNTRYDDCDPAFGVFFELAIEKSPKE